MATKGIARHLPDVRAHGPEHIWRLLVENLPDTVTMVDREGRILLDNRGLEGPSNQDETRGSVYDRVPEECREHLRESIEAVFQTGQPQYYEVMESAPDRSGSWYGNRVYPVRHNEEVVNAIIITADITRYKGEENLRGARGLGLIAELAAGIGHEINNPLAVVYGYAEVLLNSDLPEGVLSQVQNIHAASRRVARIVRDLNQLAKHSEPARLRVNLEALVGQAIDLKKQEFNARNIRFITDFPQDFPSVFVDPYQMMEALLNILTNAQQALADTPQDGEVLIQAQALGRQVKLSISDNGPGIAPENLSRVFDPFFTTRTSGSGPGLGLSISYAIVHQNGGDIWAESPPGEGATFHIRLPAYLAD